MNVEKIESLDQILGFDTTKKLTITKQKIKRLTAPGENYGSLMLSVEVAILNQGTEEILHTVAKLVPPNQMIQKYFNTSVTFVNEINFYKTIVPTFQQLEKDQGAKNLIDFFPKYLGSKLNDDGTVGQDSALILENLKIEGFVNLDRTKGFDLACSKLVIKDLASLHGLGLALKSLRPREFDEKIKPYLAPIKSGTGVNFAEDLKFIENQVGSEYHAKAKNNLDAFEMLAAREPWATITHNDVWSNNIMLKFDGNQPIKTKLVDFQLCDYASPAKDLLFFIFTSIQTEVCRAHLVELVDLYYVTLIGVLEGLKCDDTNFSKESLWEELAFEAKTSQFYRLVVLLKPIFAPNGSVKDIDELTLEDFAGFVSTELHKQKLAFVVEEFGRRGWI